MVLTSFKQSTALVVGTNITWLELKRKNCKFNDIIVKNDYYELDQLVPEIKGVLYHKYPINHVNLLNNC